MIAQAHALLGLYFFLTKSVGAVLIQPENDY